MICQQISPSWATPHKKFRSAHSWNSPNIQLAGSIALLLNCIMTDLIRDTAAGYFIRLLSGRRILRFPEEIPGFVPPFLVTGQPETVVERQEHTPNLTREVPNDDDDFDEKTEVEQTPDRLEPGSRSISLAGDDRIDQADLNNALQNVPSQIIHPVQTEDGIILVDWYSLGLSCNLKSNDHEYMC